MKKTLAAIAVVAMVLFATSAMAAGVKVPKTLCLDWASWGPTVYTQLAFKASGSLFDPASKVKTYEVTGFDSNGSVGPVSGSAYVIPGTTILHASYGAMFGLFDSPPGRFTGSYELSFDLSTGTGTLFYFYHFSDGFIIDDSDTVSSMDCRTLSVPDGTTNDDGKKAPSLR